MHDRQVWKLLLHLGRRQPQVYVFQGAAWFVLAAAAALAVASLGPQPPKPLSPSLASPTKTCNATVRQQLAELLPGQWWPCGVAVFPAVWKCCWAACSPALLLKPKLCVMMATCRNVGALGCMQSQVRVYRRWCSSRSQETVFVLCQVKSSSIGRLLDFSWILWIFRSSLFPSSIFFRLLL